MFPIPSLSHLDRFLTSVERVLIFNDVLSLVLKIFLKERVVRSMGRVI